MLNDHSDEGVRCIACLFRVCFYDASNLRHPLLITLEKLEIFLPNRFLSNLFEGVGVNLAKQLRNSSSVRGLKVF